MKRVVDYGREGVRGGAWLAAFGAVMGIARGTSGGEETGTARKDAVWLWMGRANGREREVRVGGMGKVDKFVGVEGKWCVCVYGKAVRREGGTGREYDGRGRQGRENGAGSPFWGRIWACRGICEGARRL